MVFRSMKVVTLGGRSSALIGIEGLAGTDHQLTCILGVADSGSSTGTLRRYYPIPAMGDIRSALAALARQNQPDSLIAELFEYRFDPSGSADLSGMAVGNLILGALTLTRGRLSEAVGRVNRLVSSTVTVLPTTDDPLELNAVLIDGSTVHGEHNVRGLGKPAIGHLGITGARLGILPEAQVAIREADVIVLGPGCLYTSVIAALLSPGLLDSLRASPAIKVWVGNHTTTPGQTDDMSLPDHAAALIRALDGAQLDFAVIHTESPSPAVIRSYAETGVHWLHPSQHDLAQLRDLSIEPITADTAERATVGPRALHKMDTIRHDPVRTMQAILRARRERPG